MSVWTVAGDCNTLVVHPDVDRARLLSLADRDEEALRLLDRAAVADPGDPDLHAMRAQCLLALGDARAALAAAEFALSSDPTNGHAHLIRSYAFSDLKALPPLLMESANLAVRWYPESASSWSRLVNVLLDVDQFPEAERALADMRAWHPHDPETAVAAATLEVQRPNWFSRLIGLITRPWAIVLLTLSGFGLFIYLAALLFVRYHRRVRATRAAGFLAEALAAEPDSVRLRHALSLFYEEQGRYVAALDLQLEAGADEPDPVLVDHVLRAVRRGLRVIVSVGLMVAVTGAIVIAVRFEADLLSARPGLAVLGWAFVCGLAAWLGRRWWLSRLSPGVADRVRTFTVLG